MSEINLLDFIDEKIKNFKALIYDLWNNKDKIKEMEQKTKIDKAKILISILFLSHENKSNYVTDFMQKCEIDNNEENYKKIENYIDLLLDVKEKYFCKEEN